MTKTAQTTDEPLLTYTVSIPPAPPTSPTFPFTVNVGAASLTLHPDGTFSGDIDAYAEELAKMQSGYLGYINGQTTVLAWAVLAIARLQRPR